MKTLQDIRNDLKEIRYYYTHQSNFKDAISQIGENQAVKTIKIYKDIIVSAPSRYYDIYCSLYVDGYSQQTLSDKRCYSREYIRLLNKGLLEYLYKEINKKEGDSNEQ